MNSDSPSLTVTYQLTEQDIVRFTWTALRRYRSVVFLYFGFGVVFPVLGLVCLPAIYKSAEDPVQVLTTMISMIVVLPFSMFVIIPWALRRAARRTYRSSPAVRQPITCRISSDGIASTGALTASEVGWDAVVEVLETRRDFLFYLSNQAALTIPKSALPTAEELRQLRQIVEDSPCEKVTLRSSDM